MKETKLIAVLGATGSVGMQAIDVARQRGYSLDFISVNKNERDTERLVREFSPSYLAVADGQAAKSLKIKLADTKTEILVGKEGILEGIAKSKSETVINSIIGEAGLMPTLAVIDSGKRLALSNKESLVIAGEIVMNRAKEKGAQIIPVDSEHSAIFQSLKAGNPEEIKKIILTASGGPFYGKSRDGLLSVTLADTLSHPTWKMGKKITVDSATLMNKGFEIIEAVHLFSVPAERVEVVIHRESILHSAVEYIDNTVIGEFSVPDMRACVQYAVDYPERRPSACEELDLFKLGSLSFSRPDYSAFPLLALARSALSDGAGMGAVLNAADEVAVDAFLKGELSFVGIMSAVEKAYVKMLARGKEAKELDAILALDRETREYTKGIIKEKTY